MIPRNPSAVLNAFAAAVFVAVLALAPSAAQAHAGHVHAQGTLVTQLSPDAEASAPTVEAVVVEVSAASWAAENVPDGNDCADRGCCSSGPCTGCHGLVLTPLPGAAPPSMSTLLVVGQTLPRTGSETGRLRRPPKALA